MAGMVKDAVIKEEIEEGEGKTESKKAAKATQKASQTEPYRKK